MTFLHPALLAAGLACIAIPIIIHLLMHRRRKPVMWGAMRFLLEAYKRQRRRIMLEKWLLLACRCLLIALVALAIGRPLLGRLAPGKPGKTIYILLDNSLTSGMRDSSGATSLARHKAAAKAVLKSLRSLASSGSEADRVGLISLGGPAEGLVLPASANLGSVETLIDSVETTDSRADFQGGLTLLSGALSPVEGTGQVAPRPDRSFVVLLSDYLDGSLDLAASSTDASQSIAGIKLPEGVKLISSTPATEAASNISITALEPLRSVLVDASKTPGASADLSELVRVLLRRSGDTSQPAVTTVRARIAPLGEEESGGRAAENPSERAIVRWAAGQESAVAVVPVRTDRRAAAKPGAPAAAVIVATIDDDALPADNRWRRPVELRDALRVGVVAPLRFGKADRIDKLDPGSWARLALAPAGENSGVDVIDVEPASLDAARLAALDAVVLPRPDLIPEQAWPRLKLFIDSGGLVLVTPPPGVTVHLWGDAMTKALGLDWTVARESQDAGGKKLRRGTPQAAADTASTTSSSLLNLVEGELDDLLSPVTVLRTLPMSPSPDTGEVLLRLDDNSILMWAGSPGASDAKPTPQPSTTEPRHPASEVAAGRGLFIYLGVALDLDWSDLPAKPLMVPLVQEVLRQGIGKARGNWTTIAGTRPSVPSRTTELQELADPARAATDRPTGGRIRVESAGSSAVAEPVRRAGLWRAVDDRGAVRGIVAANPDPRGGRAQTQTRDAVSAVLNKLTPDHAGGPGADAVTWLPPDHAIPGGPAVASISDAVAAVFGRVDSGSPISWPLLIGALLLALIEIVLARRASHADIAAASSPATISLAPTREAA
jgi:hypothetical protein